MKVGRGYIARNSNPEEWREDRELSQGRSQLQVSVFPF
jgi:hypothetical protein